MLGESCGWVPLPSTSRARRLIVRVAEHRGVGVDERPVGAGADRWGLRG